MSAPQFVYLISTECQSEGDPLNQGIFATRESAEAAMARHPDQPWYEIEAMPLDYTALDGTPAPVEVVGDDTPPKTIYEASLKIIWEENGPETRIYECRSGKSRPGGFLITEFDKNGGHWDRVKVESEISMEHAVEVVQQARLKFIHDREGRLDYKPNWHLEKRFPEGVA